MKENKLVYIASPYSGDVESNVNFAQKACRYCIEQGNTPIAVHLLYPQFLDDNNPEERQLGLELGLRVLQSCDEMWVCGDWLSTGMKAEVAEAGKLNIPVRQITAQQMVTEPIKEQYAIWAEAGDHTRLKGQKGFLCENGRLMTFRNQNDADWRVQVLRMTCANPHPAAQYRVESLDFGNMPQTVLRTMDYEKIKQLDIVPDFEPGNFEVRRQDYDNTGGGCMVATSEIYLPELGRCLWVSSTDENVSILSGDDIWQTDVPVGQELNYEDTTMHMFSLEDTPPMTAEPWMPIIKRALEYNIKKELAYYDSPWTMHPGWLPDSIRESADPDYLAWATERGYEVTINNGGVEVDDSYLAQRDATQADMQLQ